MWIDYMPKRKLSNNEQIKLFQQLSVAIQPSIMSLQNPYHTKSAITGTDIHDILFCNIFTDQMVNRYRTTIQPGQTDQDNKLLQSLKILESQISEVQGVLSQLNPTLVCELWQCVDTVKPV